MGGNRQRNAWCPEWLIDGALNAGFAVALAEYTLLVPKNAHEIIADVKDLFKFVETDLNTKLEAVGTQRIDTSNIVVAGTSAGGYVAYLSSMYASIKPKALVPIFAMGGNYLSDHYVVPKTEQFFLEIPFFPSDAYFRSILDLPPTAHVTNTATLDPTKDPRIAFYPYTLQTATTLDFITGIPGLSKQLAQLPEEERAAVVPASAIPLFPQLADSTSFPPTFFLHGDEDTAVKVEESRAMWQKLVDAGVECELYEKKGATHGFDNAMWEEKDEVTKRVVKFLLRHVE
ncbi:hydrolase [Pseudohyphozyma bogoriensis]|nr:hydrolase [Pseudohyphozyma bogoriensis]